MKYGIVISFLLSVVLIISCNGQSKPMSKIIKNHFITQYPDEFFFIQCGLQDKAGNMWFGSAGDGIYRYDGKSFINFTHKDGLCHNDILCCMEDKTGNIWFGTRNGIILYRPSHNRAVKNDFTNILISQHAISHATRKRMPYTYKVADNFVWSILQDKSGRIWFGTNKGLYIHNPVNDYDGDTPVFTAFLDNDSLLNQDNLHLKDIAGMVQDDEGNIWFASGYMEGEGICRFDGKSLTHFKPDDISSFRTIIKGRDGNLFFLNAFHGVYLYDGKTFTNFTQKIGLPHDTITAMMQDKAGNLWLGLNSNHMENDGKGGVWRYDPAADQKGNKALRLFTTKDGLSHNCVFCITEDRAGNIWFGTRFTGLCRYDPSAEATGGNSFTDFTDR